MSGPRAPAPRSVADRGVRHFALRLALLLAATGAIIWLGWFSPWARLPVIIEVDPAHPAPPAGPR
ncbi:MAG TPA: hypothetical protein VLH79_00205 [Chthonomonadales bacterium]|nr:hypothetical protein [Chthonomonadales bacterium]